jgi:hypothetical protein
VTGKSGSRRGGSPPLGDGWRKNPFSAMAARSASSEDAGERLKGSPVSGVTGLLSVRDGKSSTLGDRISAPAALLRGDGGGAIASGAIILRFVMLFRRSYSLKDGFLGRQGPLAAWPAAVAAAVVVVVAASVLLPGCGSAPVSIWTTCLKEVVSAWTKVVGKGVVSMVRGTGGRLLWGWAARWCCGCDGEVEDADEEEVDDEGELGPC